MPFFQGITGPTEKPLKLGVASFFLALCGAGLGFAIDYDPEHPLSFVAFGIVVVAVVAGFFAVAWGWFAVLRHRGKE